MDLSVFLLMVGGTFGVALYQLIQRYMLASRCLDEQEVCFAQNIVTAGLFAVALAAYGTAYGSSALYPEGVALFWSGVVVTAIFNALIQWMLARARTLADVSLTSPLLGTAPALAVLGGFLLGEMPTAVGFAAIGVITAGAYWHSLEKAQRWTDYLKPFLLFALPRHIHTLSVAEQVRLRNERTAVVLTCVAAIGGVIEAVFAALMVRNGNLVLGLFCHYVLLTALFTRGATRRLISLSGRDFMLGLSMGVLWFCYVVAVFYSFEVASVAYVQGLKRLAIVFVPIGALLFLKEYEARRRIGPSILIAAGAALLAFV